MQIVVFKQRRIDVSVFVKKKRIHVNECDLGRNCSIFGHQVIHDTLLLSQAGTEIGIFPGQEEDRSTGIILFQTLEKQPVMIKYFTGSQVVGVSGNIIVAEHCKCLRAVMGHYAAVIVVNIPYGCSAVASVYYPQRTHHIFQTLPKPDR